MNKKDFTNKAYNNNTIDFPQTFFDDNWGGDQRSTWKTSITFEEDLVNSPSHYTKGRAEAIEVIEDAVSEAPGAYTGFLQGQVLKYMLRLWHKIDAKQDAQKARWYLNKLIDSLD
tara:strand:+ start:4844 stop:5188 length:345 start_codon:yes stop_codon:yes gene_type:complete